MVSRKCLKKVDLENFRSESFSIRTSEGRAPASELVLQRGSLPSEIALQGGNIESKMVYRGVSAASKNRKYFRLIMNRVPEYSHLVFIIPVYLRTITLSKSLVIVQL